MQRALAVFTRSPHPLWRRSPPGPTLKGVAEQRVITIELNPKERRLYDRLRGQVVSARAPGAGSGLGDLLFLLPDLTILLLRLLRDDRVPILYKGIALAGIGYVVSPLDFMPALLMGPFGLVDDLIIVSTAVSAMMNHVHPDVVRSHWAGQGDVLDVLHRISAWTENELVGGIRGVLRRVVRVR